MTTGVRSRDVTIGGVRSPVWESGPPEDTQAVVFVHGNPGPAAEFVPLLQQVGGFARCVAPDMPGFGRADKPANFDYTVQGYARHLAGVIEELGITRAHLVGHDFGGLWGLQWATLQPDRFASATLINSGALLDYRWHLLARLWRRKPVGECVMWALNYRALKVLVRLGGKRRVPDHAVRMMSASLTPQARRAVLRLYRATEPAQQALELRRVLAPLRRPALVIWGARDIFLSVTLAARQREVFPDAQIDVLPDSGHFPHLDDPDAVAGALLPFLRARCAAPQR